MRKKDLAISRIEDARSSFKGLDIIFAPIATLRSLPINANLKLATFTAEKAPKISRGQLLASKTACKVWSKISRQRRDRDIFHSAEVLINSARELEEPEKS